MKKTILAMLCILTLSSCGTSSGGGRFDFTDGAYDIRNEEHYYADEREQDQLGDALAEKEDQIEELERELYEANERIMELELQIDRMDYNVLPEEANYVGDLLTYQFHNMYCDIPKDENYCTYFWTREDAINNDMSPCPVCNP